MGHYRRARLLVSKAMPHLSTWTPAHLSRQKDDKTRVVGLKIAIDTRFAFLTRESHLACLSTSRGEARSPWPAVAGLDLSTDDDACFQYVTFKSVLASRVEARMFS